MVTLNETALRLLLDSKLGPVGQEVQQRADIVLAGARERASVILSNADMNQIIQPQATGSNSIAVGFFSPGRFSSYLRAKDAREQNIFKPAILAAGFVAV